MNKPNLMKDLFSFMMILTALSFLISCATSDKADVSNIGNQEMIVPGMLKQEVFGALEKRPRRVGGKRYSSGIRVEVFEMTRFSEAGEEVGAAQRTYLYFFDNRLELIEPNGRFWQATAESIHDRLAN